MTDTQTSVNPKRYALQRSLVLTALVLLIAVVGCSSLESDGRLTSNAPPSETDARRLIEEWMVEDARITYAASTVANVDVRVSDLAAGEPRTIFADNVMNAPTYSWPFEGTADAYIHLVGVETVYEEHWDDETWWVYREGASGDLKVTPGDWV